MSAALRIDGKGAGAPAGRAGPMTQDATLSLACAAPTPCAPAASIDKAKSAAPMAWLPVPTGCFGTP